VDGHSGSSAGDQGSVLAACLPGPDGRQAWACARTITVSRPGCQSRSGSRKAVLQASIPPFFALLPRFEGIELRDGA
jgi:hypothetical protein